MILSVWKPHTKFINKKKSFTHYEMVDNSFIFNKGTTGYKVIWKCDNKDCKYPDKVHSIQRCHLNKNRSAFCNEEIQICHPCQFTGKGNPRFGDRRGWDDFMEKEKRRTSDKILVNGYVTHYPTCLRGARGLFF